MGTVIAIWMHLRFTMEQTERFIANIVTQKDSDINKSQTTRDGWMLRLSKETKMTSLHVQGAMEKFLRLNEWSQGLEAFISHVLVALSVTRNLTLLQSVKAQTMKYIVNHATHSSSVPKPGFDQGQEE